MKRALIDRENSLLRNMWGCVASALLLPAVIVLKLVTMPFDKPRRLSPAEVAALLCRFIDGTASSGEIDYFVSTDIADPVLNDVKDQVGKLFGIGWDDEETKARLREQLQRVEDIISGQSADVR